MVAVKAIAAPYSKGPGAEATARVVAACTVMLMDPLCESVPLTPLIFTANVPAGVLGAVAMVTSADPDPPDTDTGLKLAVAPAGRPVAVRETLPVKPVLVAMVAV
jgi:hypothetical protein